MSDRLLTTLMIPLLSMGILTLDAAYTQSILSAKPQINRQERQNNAQQNVQNRRSNIQQNQQNRNSNIQQNQQNRQTNIDQNQQDRQTNAEENQQNRQTNAEENQQNRQDFVEDNYYGGYWYGDGYYIPAGWGAWAATMGLATGLAIGTTVESPPPEYTTVYVGTTAYIYSEGVFLQPVKGTYVVVAPPAGVVVPYLPDGCTQVNVNGVVYYNCSGIYYQPVTQNNTTMYRVVYLEEAS